MSPARLLEHFDRLIDTPDAVPRLRRFILDLAVRGKLVEQDPEDEPAGELLKRITKEKVRIAGKGKACATMPVSEAGGASTRHEIPSSWKWVQVGDVAYVEMGQSPKSEFYNQHREGLPFFQGKADFGRISPTPRYWCTAPTKLAREGDILISVRAPVGPTNVATTDCCIGRGLAALRPYSGFERDFLLMCLKQSGSDLEVLGAGSTFVAINRRHLATFPVPLPSLAEQHRIVAKVDELMALCDELEAAQTKREKRRDRLVAATLHGLNNGAATPTPGAPATFEESARFYFYHLPRLTTRPEHIHQLRQTILNLAVCGKLVPQDPNDEVARRLLELIRHKKHDKRKQQNAAQDNEPESFCEIPTSWTWSTLGELAQDFHYGTSKKCSYVEIGHPVLRIPNVRGGKISTDDLKFTTLTESEVEDLSLVAGDILLIRSNGSLNLVGRPALVEKHAEGFCYAGYLVRVRFFLGTVAAPYLIIALNSELVRGQIEGPIRSAVGLKNINSTEFSNLAVPLPPLPEQRRIVAKVDELMALCTELEAGLAVIACTGGQLLEASIYDSISARA